MAWTGTTVSFTFTRARQDHWNQVMCACNIMNSASADLRGSSDRHEFCYTNITMMLKSNTHSFSAMQWTPYSSIGYKTHPLRQDKTLLVIFTNSLLQLAVPGHRAAVCCCFPELSEVYIISSGVTGSECPRHSTETGLWTHPNAVFYPQSHWSHTYLSQMFDTKSDETGITNGCGRYRPSTANKESETIWHLILPIVYGYCVAYTNAN